MPLSPMNIHSEPYAPTGNIGDSGFRKLLGTPAIDIQQMVIREAVQNCCDADKEGNGQDIRIRLRQLSDMQIGAMRSLVFADLPVQPESRERISDFLAAKKPMVLEICDFNTTGLGGPTRADRIPEDNISTDFIDFLRNVGTSRDTSMGGGTYGFGKVSLYLASKCQTILVDTRTDKHSGFERRLMGCHLGAAGSVKMEDGTLQRLTGRHWWGRCVSGETIADPLVDSEAIRLADKLGFMARAKEDSGTSIMIIDPRLQFNEANFQGGDIIETLLWNFWPRMMKTTSDAKRINFKLEVEGQSVPIPKPEDQPPFDLFCDAMNRIRSRNKNVETVTSGRGKKPIGEIALVAGLRGRRVPLVPFEESILPAQASHIAVMRPIGLVVRYFEGVPYPDNAAEWAGVFMTSSDEEVEKAFADSEPPAHDDWQPEILPDGSAKTWVRKAIKVLKLRANTFVNPVVSVSGLPGDGGNLAAVSERFGALLEQGGRRGASRRSPISGGSRSSKKRRVSSPVFSRLELIDDIRVAVFCAEVSGKGEANSIIAQPALMMDGASSSSGLDEDRSVKVLEMHMPADGISWEGEEAYIGDATGAIEIFVEMPADCAVTLSLRIEEIRGPR